MPGADVVLLDSGVLKRLELSLIFFGMPPVLIGVFENRPYCLVLPACSYHCGGLRARQPCPFLV